MMRFCSHVILLFLSIIAYPQKPGAGNTISFEGFSNRIVHEPLFNSNSLPITLSFWLKLPTSHDRVETIFNSCWGSDLTYYGFSTSFVDNLIVVSYGDGRGGPDPAFRRTKLQNVGSIEEWTHIALVVKGPLDMDIFINGINVGGSYSGSGNSMDVSSSCKMLFGYAVNNDGEQYFDGQIDEFRIWNYALNENEIRADMTRKLDGDESGLIGYWSFDEGNGAVTNEVISNNNGAIEGDVNWVLSGAPIGDESFFEYFPVGTKRKLFKHGQDSFWISTESNNWVGYHVYKVNEPPNSEVGSTMDLSNGYYGIFPVFKDQESGEYRIDFGSSECAKGDFRNGNSDVTWEEVVNKSDSSLYLVGNEIIEFAFESYGTVESIGSQYYLCSGESVRINAESNNVTAYNWFNTSSATEIEIFNQGNYWLERTTECGVFREDFSVISLDFESDFFSEKSLTVCQSDLPIFLRPTLSRNLSWSTGEVDSLISIDASGVYWAEYESGCGIIRDSVFVELIELNDVFIPNVITPNNDHLNDCFVVDDQLEGSELLVFNRAGVEVYRSTSYQNNWCPENIGSGVYFYQFSSTCYLESFKGWISVLK